MLTILAHNYLTRGFWGDEAWTAGISRLPYNEIITITGQDFHPPLYYFIVHVIGGLFDYREVPIRLISTFFFLLIPLVVYRLIRRFGEDKPLALAGSLLVLASPILITYAFEARSYGLLAFESVLSAYIFWRAKDETPHTYLWRTLYFVLGGLMVYTHYYAWFILASHAAYLLIFERKRILPMLTAALGILIVQLPWLPTLIHQTSSVKNSYWIGQIGIQTYKDFFFRVTGGDIDSVLQKPLGYVIGLLVCLGLILAFARKRLGPKHAFLLTWLLVPTLIPTLISLSFVPVFFYRYLIFSAIPLLILATEAIKSVPKKYLWLCVIPLLILELIVDYQIFSQYPSSMRETMIELYKMKKPGEGPIYTVLPAFAEVAYYANPADQVIVEPVGLVQFSGLSLLTAYNRLGYTKIEEPPKGIPYYFLTPEREVKYITE